MKYFLPILMIFASISFIFVISAQTTSAFSFPPAFPPYKSFGGRVLSYIPLPIATCIGLGTLVMTSASLIPIYTTNPLKFPSMGGQILGSRTLIPSVTTCFNTVTLIPIPVSVTTGNYGVTRY